MFPLGGHLLIARDFKGPDFSDDEVRESFSVKVQKTGKALADTPQNLGSLFRRRLEAADVEKDGVPSARAETKELSLEEEVAPDEKISSGIGLTPSPTLIGEPLGSIPSTSKLNKLVAFESDEKMAPSNDLPYAATLVSSPTDPVDELPTTQPLATSLPALANPSLLRRAFNLLRNLATPPTIAIFISFPIALIPSLKSLFVTTSASPRGPDGLAPLAFILDTASFIGAASVPLGLICLGSALARLSVPKPWTRLPLGAIGAFTVAKLFIMPILGVAVCTFFTKVVKIVDEEDKVLRFVCM